MYRRFTSVLRRHTNAGGAYTSSVYTDAGRVIAEDYKGNEIASGISGVDDDSVIQSAIDNGGVVSIINSGGREYEVNYGDEIKWVYNTTKCRREVWSRCSGADTEWILIDALPGRVYHEQFISSIDRLRAVLRDVVVANLNWAAQANPSVGSSNFADLNEIGGGINMMTGSTSGNWVSINWGSMYVTEVDKSPHMTITTALTSTTNVRAIVGLTSSTNKPSDGSGGFPADFPNDGIYINIDTAAAHPITLNAVDGGSLTSVDTGLTPTTDHDVYSIAVNDDGTEARLIASGDLVATVDTDLPSCRLQPYIALITLEDATKSMHLHDFRLIFDCGM